MDGDAQAAPLNGQQLTRLMVDAIRDTCQSTFLAGEVGSLAARRPLGPRPTGAVVSACAHFGPMPVYRATLLALPIRRCARLGDTLEWPSPFGARLPIGRGRRGIFVRASRPSVSRRTPRAGPASNSGSRP